MSEHEKVKHWELNGCVELIKSIGVTEGEYLIDFGCGFGHYTFPASLVVKGQGKVFAIDRNKDILKYIEKVVKDENISNIITMYSKEKTVLNFEDSTINCILFYDILHGEEIDRFSMIKESHRVLKDNGVLSILPFHFSNYRDKSGKKKKYKIDQLLNEIEDLGFVLWSKLENRGVHFEKYHSPHYIDKGGINFEELERGTIYNFKKV
jgi:ubiquinone/menaquinone biosynthesis C-methylase UbiE